MLMSRRYLKNDSSLTQNIFLAFSLSITRAGLCVILDQEAMMNTNLHELLHFLYGKCLLLLVTCCSNQTRLMISVLSGTSKKQLRHLTVFYVLLNTPSSYLQNLHMASGESKLSFQGLISERNRKSHVRNITWSMDITVILKTLWTRFRAYISVTGGHIDHGSSGDCTELKN